MQIGYNNDVQYRGKTFHIQTEDHGQDNAAIESQIFHAGAILDTSIISYQDVLDETDDVDERIARIRQMMQVNHKSLYRKLRAGEYDEYAGLDPVEAPEEVEVDDLVPSQDRVPAQAVAIEKGEVDPTQLPDAEKHTSLSDLKSKLAGYSKRKSNESEAEVDDAPTMISRPDDVAATQQMAAMNQSNGASDGLPAFSPTGHKAWRGCEPARQDLSIIELVEEFVS